ncbi:hypothetical protein Tco_0066775 [Tanacetum coccineum]
MSIRFAPIGWCRIEEVPNHSRWGLETDIKQKDKKKAKITKPSTGWKRQSNQGQSQSKSKDSQVEETQLEGLKLPNLKLYYKG